MGMLRRAIGRKDVIIGLLVFLIAGGWFGWRYVVRPAMADVVVSLTEDSQTAEALQTFSGLADVRSLLDAGQYPQALIRSDELVAQFGDQPAILSYKTLAQLLAGNATAAAASGDAALAAGATGPDAAIAFSAKALMAFERPDLAKPLALQAFQQASGTSQAALVARVAFAAAVRAEHDLAKPPTTMAERTQVIEQALGPILSVAPTQPASAWQARFWRHGLALLADSRMLAGPAGDAEAIALMQSSCPPDAWNCYFQIPPKALAAAQSGQLDDHARVAALVATGFLYLGAGDRPHGDAALRRAVEVYGHMLEVRDDWDGPVMRTVTPQGQFKNVGQEFYTYRNRMERLAMYSADYWGNRAVAGRASLSESLARCDHRLFRALVRMRADRDTDPVQVLREEQIRELDFGTVGDYLLKHPNAAQADWERERATLIQRIGQEEVRATDAIRKARQLVQEGRDAQALDVLLAVVNPEPSLSETRVMLRCEIAWILMRQGSFAEAWQVLDEADRILAAGDEHPAFGQNGQRVRIDYYRMRIARGMGYLSRAILLAEQLVRDPQVRMSLRARTLLDLVEMQIEASDQSAALDAYRRLASLPVTEEESQAFLQPILLAAQSRLNQKGWLGTLAKVQSAGDKVIDLMAAVDVRNQ